MGPWWWKVDPIYWLPSLAVFVGTLLAPTDLLTRWPMLAAACRVILQAFPFMGSHAAFAVYPELMIAIKCITLVMLPVVALLPFLRLWKERGQCLAKWLENGPPLKPWFEGTVLLVLVVMFVGNWVIPGDPGNCRGCETSAKLGLAFINSSAMLVFSLLPISLVMVLYYRLALHVGVVTTDSKEDVRE